ncbi:E3 ubiquitin-protein ligase dbl4 [Sphaceloma murrayae]|uniref:RBR-type E3 ubiquitin transferase n=1 Tax=Sphaceloma murrayae TaxID=2082308 RepID=A0A2K1QP41_9PEZI|nr:E3 ubiquitin-protein ligase dbl4 [Sphaceloma murrayae]
MAPLRRSSRLPTDTDDDSHGEDKHRRNSLPRKAKEKVQSYAGQAGVTTMPRATKRRRINNNRTSAKSKKSATASPSDIAPVAASHSEEPERPAERWCTICTMTSSESTFPQPEDVPLACRAHITAEVCNACLVRYAREDIHHGSLPHCALCGISWDYTDAARLLGTKEVESFEARLSNRLIEGSPDFRWCAQDKCISGQFYHAGQTAADPKVCCATCEKSNCFICRAPWHEGMTCTEFQEVKKEGKDRGFQQTMGTLRKLVTKMCPVCGSGTTKIDGCAHMICVNCGSSYNWDTAPVL